ncbi:MULTISPECIES: hypothetical protein [unclassified Actinomyces]|uniref:hypothetical protein n=1 Tax=unclassified Actinomyces TaxID=2609248 RepID=UPI0027BA09B2|nr:MULTISPECIES: hypothetical protein [unclassified Actinomyces]
MRDRLVSAVLGRPAPAERVEEAIESCLAGLLLSEAQRAALETERAWRRAGSAARPLSAALSALPPEAERARRAEDLVRCWQGDVLDMVRAEGADKRLGARLLSLGVNGVGVALMVIVFAHTGGLTGLEVGVAGGTALVAQRLAALVDVLVWVLDPEKYADAVIHHDFIAPMAEHATVAVVALNQVDRLDAHERRQAVRDLTRLLAAEGLDGVDVVEVSARTGEGVQELRSRIRQVAGSEDVSARRLTADTRTLAARARDYLEGQVPERRDPPTAMLSPCWRRRPAVPWAPSASPGPWRSRCAWRPPAVSAGCRCAGRRACALTRCAGCTSTAR